MAASMIEGTTALVRTLRDEDGASYHGVARYRVQAVVGDQAIALDAVILAMYDALAADAQLVAALRQPTGDSGQRIFHGEAPTGQTLNYVVIGDASEAEDTGESAYEMVAVDDEVTLDIWGIAKAPQGTTYPNRHYGIARLYKHIARILNTKRLVLA